MRQYVYRLIGKVIAFLRPPRESVRQDQRRPRHDLRPPYDRLFDALFLESQGVVDGVTSAARDRH
jgi:hypothetical protein